MTYEWTDIPEGMTAAEYRRALARVRWSRTPRRLALRQSARNLCGLFAGLQSWRKDHP